MKTAFRYIVLVVVCATLFIGCGNITRRGTDYNSENISNLKVGKTTEQEVIHLIGQPFQRTQSADGTVILEYMYKAGQTTHMFTAITNPGIYRDMHMGIKKLTVILGSDGKVKDFKETVN